MVRELDKGRVPAYAPSLRPGKDWIHHFSRSTQVSVFLFNK